MNPATHILGQDLLAWLNSEYDPQTVASLLAEYRPIAGGVGEDKTVLDGILKDIYTDVVREQVSLASPLQDKFEKVKDYEWDGRQAIEAAIMSLNEGVGAVSENANLPQAGNFDPQNFKIPMKFVYGVFQMTAQMMESAKTTKGAFRNATRYSMESLVRNLKRENARMLWGSGVGVLALVNGAVTTSTTVNVDAPMNIAGAIGGARFLRKGMVLAFLDASNAIQAVRTVSSVAAAGTSIVVDASMSADDNAKIVRISLPTSTSLNDSGFNNEPMGILGLVDDGTFVGTLHNLSRTTYPQLKSRVQASVGALSLDGLQLNIDVMEQLGEEDVDFFACHHSVRRAYLTLLEADRRYTMERLMSPDGGTKVAAGRRSWITFGGKEMITDRNAPYGMLFGLTQADFKVYVQNEGEWAEEDGKILRNIIGKDVWTAFYRMWLNRHNSRPNTNFRMEGITATAVYVANF